MNNEMYYEFECGCRVKQFSNNLKNEDGLPPLEIDFKNLRSCPKAWTIFFTGETKGIFQLEGSLGKQWSKKVQPIDIDEIAALISLIRPGCLQAVSEGKNMTQHYVDRKMGNEELPRMNEELKDILKDTFCVITYQEQAMKIAAQLAGFDLKEADWLRKAIGKKDVKLMAKVEQLFYEKAKSYGKLSEGEAKEVFGWIKESQRYSFNKSHGVGYGVTSYWTAWAKAHFPLHFYTSYLYYSKEKPKPYIEIDEIVKEATKKDISIIPPCVSATKDYQFHLEDSSIRWGITNIKKVGSSHVKHIVEVIQEAERSLKKTVDKFSWFEFLVHVADNVNSGAMNNIILVGALPQAISRKAALFEYNTWQALTDKEKEKVKAIAPRHTTLLSCLIEFAPLEAKQGGPHTQKRRDLISDLIKSLEKPPYSLDDSTEFVIKNEIELLGTAITRRETEALRGVASIGVSCKDYKEGRTKDKDILLTVVISSIRPTVIKKGNSAGRNMCFMTIEDESESVDSVLCFADCYESNKHLLYQGNTVMLKGDKSKDGGAFVVKKVIQL